MVKKVLITLLVILVIIQFFKPEKNISTAVQAASIEKVYEVPPQINGILQKACYDCHSNNTTYPWYVNIQPVAWWMDDHIKEGKRELNFSEFGNYPLMKQDHKLEEVAEQIIAEMPLKSYTIAHSDAKLTAAEKQALTDWANALRKEIQSKM